MKRLPISRTILLLAGLAACTGCDADRIDEDRRDVTAHTDDTSTGEDTGTETGPTDTDTGLPTDLPTDTEEDAGTGTEQTDQPTETDYSCDEASCTADEECGCMERAICPQQGPDFIKNHCLIVDCDAADPSTCPDGKNCIDATSFSDGQLSWVCFNF